MGLGIKSYLTFKAQSLMGKNESFGLGYHEWQSRRILAMLDHYGVPFFRGKSILELGAGHGDIGNVFSFLGAKVTCLEGRDTHVAELKRRHPAVEAFQHDCNNPLPDVASSADLIIHFGVLYHLRDPEASLRNTCRACTFMVLETECSDSSDPAFTRQTSEHAYRLDHALDGVGCSPSPTFVERVLTEEGMEFTRILDNRCNAGDHVYDWPITNSGATRKGQRRFWFVKKR